MATTPRPTQAKKNAPEGEWVLVKPKEEAPKLRQKDWSVPIMNLDQLQQAETREGVAIATKAQAERLPTGARDGRLAVVVLGESEVAGGSKTLVVTERGRRIETRPAVVLQLGKELVQTQLVAKVRPIPEDHVVRVSVSVARRYASPEAWTECGKGVREFVAAHLLECGAQAADTHVTGVETRGSEGKGAQF
ncbi:hypothetical protein DIPPA_15013 [Diplonema papillatum]|nr:hypothetical protein DIPPA_15013 [Diplonema papillatum]